MQYHYRTVKTAKWTPNEEDEEVSNIRTGHL